MENIEITTEESWDDEAQDNWDDEPQDKTIETEDVKIAIEEEPWPPLFGTAFIKRSMTSASVSKLPPNFSPYTALLLDALTVPSDSIETNEGVLFIDEGDTNTDGRNLGRSSAEVIHETKLLDNLKTITGLLLDRALDNIFESVTMQQHSTRNENTKSAPGLTNADNHEPWSCFFPFQMGENLLIKYKTPVCDFEIGNCTVLEHSSTLLGFNIFINNCSFFNVSETEALIEIQYNKEGYGNLATIQINDNSFVDNNVTIHSGKQAREIFLPIRILGQEVNKISIEKIGPNEGRLKLKASSGEHILILNGD